MLSIPNNSQFLVPSDDQERAALVERLKTLLTTYSDRGVYEQDVDSIDAALQKMMRYSKPKAAIDDDELVEAVQNELYGSGRRLKIALETYRFRSQYPNLLRPPRRDDTELRYRPKIKASEEVRTAAKWAAIIFFVLGLADVFAGMAFGLPVVWWYVLLMFGLSATFAVYVPSTAPSTEEYYCQVPISAADQAAAITTALKNHGRILALVNKNLIQPRLISPFSCKGLTVLGDAANPTTVHLQFTVQAPYETVNGTEYAEELVHVWNYVDDDMTDEVLVNHFTRGMKSSLDTAINQVATKLGIGTGYIPPRDRLF